MNLDVSPYKRLREATGFSKAYVYKSAGLSESALTFVEAGMYAANPPALDQELLRLCTLRDVPFQQILDEEYGAGTIPAATVLWQQAKRRQMGEQVLDGFQRARTDPDDRLSPMEDFAQRVSGSKTAFCKALKVQVGMFYQFDKGQTFSMPKALAAALLDAGLPQRSVTELEDEQIHWVREHKHVEQVELVD